MTGVIFNPNNWWLYIGLIFLVIWFLKKPARRDESLVQKIQELEEGAQRADQVLFDRVDVLERQLDKVNQQFHQERTSYEKTIYDLQERMQVLEAIVTDSRYDLDKKIRAL